MSKPLRSFRMSFSILIYLATHPNETPYRIEKQLKIDGSTVRAALKILVKANLVSVSGKPKKLPTGLVRKEYRVTPQGVVALLQGHPEYVTLSISDIGSIAEKQTAFLPLIFGKWEYFRNQRLERIAYEFLLEAAKRSADEVKRLTRASNGEKLVAWSAWHQESVHRHDIYEFMLLRAWNYGWKFNFKQGDPRDAWVNAIRNDKDLAKMCDKEIDMLTEDVRNELQFYDNCRAYFKGERVAPGVRHLDHDETWDEFKGNIRYLRTRALDENRSIPSEYQITQSIRMRDLLEGD